MHEILDVPMLFQRSTYVDSKIVGSIYFVFIHFLSICIFLPLKRKGTLMQI